MRHNKKFLKSTFVLLGAAALLLLPAQSKAQDASSLPPQNPTLAHFDADVTFYASFDGHATADLSNGKGEPQKKDLELTYAKGIWQQALHGAPQALVFLGQDNVNLARPGGLSFWVKPQDWTHEEAPKYIHFIVIHNQGVTLQVSRMGNTVNKEQVYAYTKIGSKGVVSAVGNSRGWKNEWHLLAANWGDGYIEFSVDGSPFQRKSTPKIEASNKNGGVMNVANGSTAAYLMDELFIYNRPLSNDDIQWIWQSNNTK